MCPIYHIPALLNQTIEGLDIRPDGHYVDVTFGGGGHSKAIFEHLGKQGRLYGFDQDIDAEQNSIADKRFTFIHSNFRYIKNFMTLYDEIGKIDGIVADLGVSFHHFDSKERGFSFRFDGDLDMRMNQSARLTAAEIVNTYTEERLAEIFYLYGELNKARQIARKIATVRRSCEITRIEQLNDIVTPFCGKDKEKKDLARVFQALRIETNDELGALRKMLTSTLDILKQGGRIAVLTYHSLEDRIVKNFLRSGNFEGKAEKDFYGNLLSPFEIINNKVITADANEVEANPRARSAKLRIAAKK